MGPIVRSRGIQLKGWQGPTCQPRIRAGIRHILMLQPVCPGPAVRAKTLHDNFLQLQRRDVESQDWTDSYKGLISLRVRKRALEERP